MDASSILGMEITDEVLGSDLEFPLNEPGMKLCVGVLTAGRPGYLYICLDAIFRNTAFNNENKPDVYVYVDVLASGKSYAKEILAVCSNFPIRQVFINEKHKGIAETYWYAFNKAFYMGYDYCVMIEEDWLITTDALQWLYDCPKITFHYSLYRWEDHIGISEDGSPTILYNGEHLSWCTAFSRDSFNFVYNIIKAKAYIGLFDSPPSIELLKSCMHKEWDRILIVIFKQYKLTSLAPPRSLLLHFGSKSSIYCGFGYGTNPNYLFDGIPEKWLDNLISFLNTASSETQIANFYRPANFIYR